MNKVLKYNQAKYAIFDLIARARLAIGDRLPSLHALCSMFPFSEISVRRALDELEEQGYVVKRRGSGVYLARAIDAWEKRGSMLYLQIDPASVWILPGVATLRQYLRDRCILLETISASRPGGEVVEAARDCIGIFASGYVTKEWTAFLSTLGKPVLYIGANAATQRLPCIGFDWRGAVRLAMGRLASGGARRVGLITGDKNWFPAHLIATEYLEQVRSLGLEHEEGDILWKPVFDSFPVEKFLRGNPRFDAFLVELGALPHLLLASRQCGVSENAPVAVLGQFEDHYSSDKFFFVGFQDDIYIESAKAFFASLNDLDYFKDGPRLLAPHFIPGSSRHLPDKTKE